MVNSIDFPKVLLLLELGYPLHSAPKPSLEKQTHKETTRLLRELLLTLGIPTQPVLQIKDLADANRELLRISIGGLVCRYPDELLIYVYSHVTGHPMTLASDLNEVRSWLISQIESDESGSKSVVKFISLACIEILKNRLSILLGKDQVAAYMESLPFPNAPAPGSEPPGEVEVRPILLKLVDLGISLADKQTVTEVLSRGLSTGSSMEDIAEDLITTLGPDLVEIQLHPEFLREVTVAENEDQNVFNMLRDGLFYDLGIIFPPFKFATNEDLPPGCVAFKINHIVGLPRWCLRKGDLGIAESSENLRRLGIEAQPALNPYVDKEASIIRAVDRSRIQDDLTTWTPMGFLVLNLAAELRNKSSRFVTGRIVREQLSKLEQVFPALVQAVQQKVSTQQLTRAMRFLAGEGLSIRDLKQILEAVLDYDYIVINDSEKMIIFDDRIATDEMPDHTWIDDPKNLTSYIRTRMKRFISHRFTQGSNNLVTFLLDPRLESFILKKAKDKRMLEENWLSMAHLEEIIHAFNEQLEIGVRSFTQQSILTTAEVRPYLYEILAPIFPRLQVLAYQELSPDINIQPIGRIEPEIDYKE